MEKYVCDFCGADMKDRSMRVDLPGKFFEDCTEDINENLKREGKEPTTTEALGKDAGEITLQVDYLESPYDCCPNCLIEILETVRRATAAGK